jgi:O-phosphoseryl-tRNA(Cys) synthetase
VHVSPPAFHFASFQSSSNQLLSLKYERPDTQTSTFAQHQLMTVVLPVSSESTANLWILVSLTNVFVHPTKFSMEMFLFSEN